MLPDNDATLKDALHLAFQSLLPTPRNTLAIYLLLHTMAGPQILSSRAFCPHGRRKLPRL
jgi:hypothetical protein